jgi:hypothetical protein
MDKKKQSYDEREFFCQTVFRCKTIGNLKKNACQCPHQPGCQKMNDKIENVIPSGIKLADPIIYREGIYPYHAGLGKYGPYLIYLVKTPDIRGIEQKIIVIKDEIKSKRLGINGQA